jgi:hypothetical protein
MFDTSTFRFIDIPYGGYEEKKGNDFLSSTNTVEGINPMSLLPPIVDSEMIEIENAAIIDFLNFEALD